MKKQRRPRETVKRDITENQFVVILKKVCRPIGVKTSESASKRGQASGVHRSDRFWDSGLCGLIYELGLEPTFWTFEAKEPVAPKGIENWGF